MTQGLSKQEYWKQHVKTKEDVIKYYQLYYPEYPDVLGIAIANRLEQFLVKARSGEQLTDEEQNFLKQREPQHWDPKDEIAEQKLQAQIALTQRRLEELMK